MPKKAAARPAERNWALGVCTIVILSYVGIGVIDFISQLLFDHSISFNDSWATGMTTMANLSLGAILTILSGGMNKEPSHEPDPVEPHRAPVDPAPPPPRRPTIDRVVKTAPQPKPTVPRPVAAGPMPEQMPPDPFVAAETEAQPFIEGKDDDPRST